MAKESMKAREVRRAKLVAKYAEKRAALKQIVRTGDPAEAFEATQKLQELPKNSNPIRMHNRCKLTGRPKGYIPKDISVSLASPESSSVRWLLTVLFPVLRKQAGNFCFKYCQGRPD